MQTHAIYLESTSTSDDSNRFDTDGSPPHETKLSEYIAVLYFLHSTMADKAEEAGGTSAYPYR